MTTEKEAIECPSLREDVIRLVRLAKTRADLVVLVFMLVDLLAGDEGS